MQYTKESQLKHNKKQKKGKLSRPEKIKLMDWQREECGGICQIPNCTNKAQDNAHKSRAYKRNDYESAMICRYHHQVADEPTPKETELSEWVNEQLDIICDANRDKYLGVAQ